MDTEAVRRAVSAAEVFIQRANAVLQDVEPTVYICAATMKPIPLPKASGARVRSANLRRVSMELTRNLAEMRRGPLRTP